MIAEDLWLDDIKDYEREIAEQAVAIQHLAGDLKEKEETILNLEVDISTYRDKMKSAIRQLDKAGITRSEIAQSLQLEIVEVEGILENED